MNKILWLDLETSGLDETKHAITQLACLVDQDNNVIDKLNLYMRPFKGDKISKESLEKQKISVKDLYSSKYQEPELAFNKFIEFMDKHIDRYNRFDKFILAGKNIKKFDVRFLRRFFEKCFDDYYGSWFHYPCIDIESVYAELMVHSNKFILPNYQLETICEHFDIDLDAHDAYNDIIATRELYYKLTQ